MAKENIKLKHMISIYGKEPSTFDELCEAIIATINHNNPGILVGLSFDLQYSTSVSNSHDAPHNGVTNWSGQNKSAPLYYRGLVGRIWYRLSRKNPGFSSNLFGCTMVHTGTGGGGGYNGPWEKVSNYEYNLRRSNCRVDDLYIFSFDCRIFLDDFPALDNEINKRITYDLLRDKTERYKFNYFWCDKKYTESDERTKLLYENVNKIPKIIGLVGLIGSGKDTVADILKLKMKYRTDSFAHNLKGAISVIFNWSFKDLSGTTPESRQWRDTVDTWWSEKLGIPNLTPRWVLQNIGTDVMRNHFHDKIWIASLERKINNSSDKIVITDCRFPNEIEAIRNLGGVIVRVKRNDPDWVTSGENLSERSDIHPSEYSWLECDMDYTIENDGTLEELPKKVTNMIEYFMLK